LLYCYINYTYYALQHIPLNNNIVISKKLNCKFSLTRVYEGLNERALKAHKTAQRTNAWKTAEAFSLSGYTRNTLTFFPLKVDRMQVIDRVPVRAPF
jgi:hypothetical protein